MILDAIISWGLKILEAIIMTPLGLLPHMPDWVTTGFQGLTTIMSWAYELDHWVPVSLAMTVGGAVMVAYGVAFTAQCVRTVVSYLTLGGGAT